MKKILITIAKILGSIVIIPFAVVGGILYGLCLMICYMFGVPIAAISSLWD